MVSGWRVKGDHIFVSQFFVGFDLTKNGLTKNGTEKIKAFSHLP